MPSPKPTRNQVLQWLHEQWQQEAQLDSAAQAEEDLYFQQFSIPAPEGYRTVRLGTAPGDVDQGVQAVQPDQYIGVTVPAAKATEEWQKLADARSKWCRALLSSWREDMDVIELVLWGMLVHRARWVFVGYQPLPEHLQSPPTPDRNESAASYGARVDAWDLQRRMHVPFTFELQERGTCFAIESHTGHPLHLFQHYQRTVSDLEYWFPPSIFPAIRRITMGMSPTQYVTFTQYWNDSWRCAFVNEQPFYPSADNDGFVANEYGRIPFVKFAFRQLPTAAGDKARQYRGFLTNGKEAYELESIMASQFVAITSRAAWPVTLTRFLDGRQFSQVPGTSFNLNPGETVEPFAGEGPLPAVGDAWERLRLATRQNALGAAAGQMPPGIRSALALNMVQGVDRGKVLNASRALARGLTECLTIAEQILERIHRQPVSLPAAKRDQGAASDLQLITVGPRDIRGYYRKDVNLGPQFGQEVYQRALMLAQLVAAKFLSRKRAWGFVPELIDSVTDAERELILETSDNHPLMIQAHVAERLREWAPDMFEMMVAAGAFNMQNAEESSGPQQPAAIGPSQAGAQGGNDTLQNPGTGPQMGAALAGGSPTRSPNGAA